MSTIYVFAASRFEATSVERLFRPLPKKQQLPQPRTDTLGQNEIVLFRTGIGPRRARAAAEAAFNSTASLGSSDVRNEPRFADAAIMVGLCGGLTRSICEIQLVLYTESLSASSDQTALACSPLLTARLTDTLRAAGLRPLQVKGVMSDRVATTKNERERLAETGSQVVDMESHEIISAAKQCGVPVAVLRVVSDGYDRTMPDFNRALKDNGDFDAGIAARVCITHPLLTAQMIAVSRKAIQRLNRAMEILLPAPVYSELRT